MKESINRLFSNNLHVGFLTILLVLGLASCNSDDDTTVEGPEEEETMMEFEPKVFIGDIQLLSQEEVNVFGIENYTRITGTLRLGRGVPNDIGNLAPLLSLGSVGEDFLIDRGNGISTLTGLNNLTSVAGRFDIAGAFLRNLDGLESLTTVQSMIIDGREVLENINGLTGLTDSAGLSIRGEFDNVDALSNLVGVDFLTLSSSRLNNLTGLGHITNFSKLNISGSNNLTSLDDLSSDLFQIGNLEIFDCNSLNNLNGLSSLTQLGRVELSGNDTLENLDILENLTIPLQEVRINYNLGLTDFCGLQTPFENFGFPAFFVSNNAYNPTKEQILDGDCSI